MSTVLRKVNQETSNGSALKPSPVLFMLNSIKEEAKHKKSSNIIVHDYDLDPNGFALAALQEKTFIFPNIADAFKNAVAEGAFDRKKDRIIDIGCGPFLIALPFLRDGITVDGIDSSANMLDIAKNNLTAAHFALKQPIPKKIQSAGRLPKDYGFAMMNFVHQCCPNKESLNNLMGMAFKVLKPEAHLFISGSHPDYLDKPHSLCEYDIDDVSSIREGRQYKGRLYNPNNDTEYRLHGDHYWKIESIVSAAKNAGFSHDAGDIISIPDFEPLSPNHPKSADPAYFGMTLKKPANALK